MVRHHDEILSFLTQGSTSIGVGEAIFARNLESVKGSLRDIEALHQRTFQRDGHLRSPEFFAERKHLFSQLDTHLTGLTKKGIGFPDHPNLKSALGISSRSLVHRWTKAGGARPDPRLCHTHRRGRQGCKVRQVRRLARHCSRWRRLIHESSGRVYRG